MIEVRIDGQPMDMARDSTWEQEIYNPLLQLDGLVVSKGLGISLANTAYNNKILNWPGKVHGKPNKRMYACDVLMKGNLIDSGYAYIRNAANELVLDYTGNAGGFFGAWQNMKLSEVDLGTVSMPSTLAGWNATRTHTHSSGGYVLPTVGNTAYYKVVPGSWDNKMNGYVAGSYVANTPKVPMFYVKHILNKIALLAGVNIVGDYWTNELNDIVLFNTKEATDGTNEVRQYMPDVTVVELLMAIRKLSNMVILIGAGTKTMRLSDGAMLMAGSVKVDWSSRMGKVSGTPKVSDGLVLSTVADSTDGLRTDGFYKAYPAPDMGEPVVTKIESAASGLMINAGIPTCQVQGRTAEQPDGKWGLKLINWNGGNASNVMGGKVMNATGMMPNWLGIDRWLRDSYYVETVAALTAIDVAWASDCMRGLRDEAAVVHVHGANYVLSKLIIGNDKVLVGMYRL
jgi:hypothetical protein